MWEHPENAFQPLTQFESKIEDPMKTEVWVEGGGVTVLTTASPFQITWFPTLKIPADKKKSPVCSCLEFVLESRRSRKPAGR